MVIQKISSSCAEINEFCLIWNDDDFKNETIGTLKQQVKQIEKSITEKLQNPASG